MDPPRAPTWKDLSPAEAKAALDAEEGLIALDVRTDAEHRSHRLPGAVLVPVDRLGERHDELDPEAPYLVHCEHGIRSVAACEALAALGFADVRNLRGGLARWVGAGLPVER